MTLNIIPIEHPRPNGLKSKYENYPENSLNLKSEKITAKIYVFQVRDALESTTSVLEAKNIAFFSTNCVEG